MIQISLYLFKLFDEEKETRHNVYKLAGKSWAREVNNSGCTISTCQDAKTASRETMKGEVKSYVSNKVSISTNFDRKYPIIKILIVEIVSDKKIPPFAPNPFDRVKNNNSVHSSVYLFELIVFESLSRRLYPLNLHVCHFSTGSESPPPLFNRALKPNFSIRQIAEPIHYLLKNNRGPASVSPTIYFLPSP